MDLSAVNSAIRSSSDFSIERILSEDPRSRQEGEPPSWLYCTRYQPPRLPRGSITSACRSRRSGRHARVPFTSAQAAALEAAYARSPYLAPPALRALAAALQLRDDRIKIWFQNRRARERREKCTTITPPNSVTLLATSLPHMPHTPHGTQWTSNTSHACMKTRQMNLRCYSEPPGGIAVRDRVDNIFSGRKNEIDSDEDSAEERPETPLDIETVED